MKVTIGKKITGGFGIILFVVAIAGIFLIMTANEYQQDVKDNSKIQSELIITQHVRYSVIMTWQFLTDASLTKDESVINTEAKPQLDEAKASIDKLIELSSDDVKKVDFLNSFKSSLNNFYSAGVQMFNSYKVDWAKGNEDMEKFDKFSEQILADIEQLAQQNIEASNNSANEMEQMSGGLKTSSIIVSILVIIVGIIVSYFVTRMIVNPVKQLDLATSKFMSGDNNVIVEVKSNDELGKLAGTFNAMIEKIGIMVQYLENLPAPVMSIDKEFNIQYMNKKGAEVVGKDQSTIFRLTMTGLKLVVTFQSN